MASVEAIAAFRLIIGEPDETTYSDAALSVVLDAATVAGYSSALPARDIWRQKAATYSALVSISEGGSSRSNSDLFARAMQMAEMYANLVDKEDAVLNVPGAYTTISKLSRH